MATCHLTSVQRKSCEESGGKAEDPVNRCLKLVRDPGRRMSEIFLFGKKRSVSRKHLRY